MRLYLFLFLCVALQAFPPLEFGWSVAHPEPWSASAGVRWDNWRLRLEGGGWYNNSHTGWGAVRCVAGHEWLSRDWYGIETALSGGYFRAQAADSMHIAVNQATGRKILYESSWEESLDISAQFGVRLAFIHARIGVPFHLWGNQEPGLLWQIGLHWTWENS